MPGCTGDHVPGLTDAFVERACRDGLTLVIGTGSVAAVNLGGLLHELASTDPGPTAVILTEAAQRFVTPAALRHLGRCPVLTRESLAPTLQPLHVWLSDVARRVLVYPASAGFMARAATGAADDLAATTLLCATGIPTLLVPSMHPRMWASRLVQHNVRRLQENGAHVLDTRDGTAPHITEVAATLAALTRTHLRAGLPGPEKEEQRT
ncbi:flavoprotein [Streptomyces sp. NPDC002476]|uniref:flavoprotein n=1 Tax=Streptomyces sp. NPDC002476 TaxID=3364648 RepID=UPI00368B215E